jgi:hypothetical protein
MIEDKYSSLIVPFLLDALNPKSAHFLNQNSEFYEAGKTVFTALEIIGSIASLDEPNELMQMFLEQDFISTTSVLLESPDFESIKTICWIYSNLIAEQNS